MTQLVMSPSVSPGRAEEPLGQRMKHHFRLCSDLQVNTCFVLRAVDSGASVNIYSRRFTNPIANSVHFTLERRAWNVFGNIVNACWELWRPLGPRLWVYLLRVLWVLLQKKCQRDRGLNLLCLMLFDRTVILSWHEEWQ